MVVLQEKLAHMNCSASPCEEGGGSCDTFGITDDDDNVATFDACVKGDVLSLADMLRNPAKLGDEQRREDNGKKNGKQRRERRQIRRCLSQNPARRLRCLLKN